MSIRHRVNKLEQKTDTGEPERIRMLWPDEEPTDGETVIRLKWPENLETVADE